jgi:hypothetical protein
MLMLLIVVISATDYTMSTDVNKLSAVSYRVNQFKQRNCSSSELTLLYSKWWKVVGSTLDVVMALFSVYLILPAAIGPRFTQPLI